MEIVRLCHVVHVYHLSSEQHLVLARPFETFPQEQGLLGYPLPVRRKALIGSHKTRCACRVNLRHLQPGDRGGG